MRSSWNHATDVVFGGGSDEQLGKTHNPWVVLQTVSRDRIKNLLADPAFRAQG